MPTRNASRLESAFRSGAQDRDYVMLGSIALGGTTGGLVAADVSSRLMRMVFDTPSPGTVAGRTANGLTKVGLGVLFGLMSAPANDVHTYAGLTVAMMGLGAVAAGGADLVGVARDQWGGNLPFVGNTVSRSRTRSRSRRLQRAQRNGGSGANAGTQSRRQMSGNQGAPTSAYGA